MSCLLVALSWGCVPKDIAESPERRDKGLVIVLPGIEGPSVWNRDLILGLDDGGVDCAIQRYEWGTAIPGGFLINLADIESNKREADVLRDLIVEYQRQYPGRPVALVGHSGGAGMALLTAERMPLGHSLQGIVLLAAAVSPTFDTTAARRNIDGHILNCYSNLDAVILGMGTSIFGTIDRKHGSAAGTVGFEDSLATRESELAPLQQVAWTSDMARLGNFGGHAGWTNRTFVKQWLAPRVRKMLRPSNDAKILNNR